MSSETNSDDAKQHVSLKHDIFHLFDNALSNLTDNYTLMERVLDEETSLPAGLRLVVVAAECAFRAKQAWTLNEIANTLQLVLECDKLEVTPTFASQLRLPEKPSRAQIQCMCQHFRIEAERWVGDVLDPDLQQIMTQNLQFSSDDPSTWKKATDLLQDDLCCSDSVLEYTAKLIQQKIFWGIEGSTKGEVLLEAPGEKSAPKRFSRIANADNNPSPDAIENDAVVE